MIPALNMEEYPFLQLEAPPEDGWTRMLEGYMCPYVLKEVIKQHHKFGFDLYIHNTHKKNPYDEYDEIWVKIYSKKKPEKKSLL